MNKIDLPTYLSNDKESLIVSAVEIEGGRGIPLDINSLLGQFQRVIKSAKLWCGDKYIISNVTPQVFLPSRKSFQ